MEASSVLSQMPRTSSAFSAGDLSWSVVRAVVVAVRCLDAAGRAAVDAAIGSAPDLDPEALLGRVDDIVARLRDDLVRAREDRAISQSFLAIQGRLDGSATLYGEGDAASIATLVEALDAVADAPVNAENEDAVPRAATLRGAHLDL